MGGTSGKAGKAAEIREKSRQRPTSELLSDALDTAQRIRGELAGVEGSAAAVCVSSEFGGRINDAANAARNIVSAISNCDKEPAEIVAGLQGVTRVCEDIAIRYRKVDLDASIRLRKAFTDIQYGQPGGTVQLMRDILTGVYEGDGHGTLCLREVVRISIELCGAIAELDREVCGGPPPAKM